MGLDIETSSPEDKIPSTFADTAAQIGSTLAVIEHNNREIFWWTSWAIGIVLGLFMLQLLVKVHAQLVKLNACQSAFHELWEESKINDERARYAEIREKMEEKREKERRQEALKEALARIGADSDSDDVLDGVGSESPEGTPEHE